MGCPQAKTCTIVLRGGAEQFLEETERSLHDAIMIVRRALKHDAVVAGGCEGGSLPSLFSSQSMLDTYFILGGGVNV